MRKIISVFALLALFIFPVWVCAQPTSPPTNQQQAQPNTPAHQENDSNKTFWQRTTADPIAFYTFWLAIFTLVLATVSVFQWCALRRAEKISKGAIDLARDEFIVSHRPRIIVRKIGTAIDNGPMFAEYHIVNIGESESVITDIGHEIIAIDSDLESGWYPGDCATKSINVVIKCGQAIRIPVEMDKTIELALTAGRRTNKTIILFGWIGYEDKVGYEANRGIIRTTSFIRQYDFVRHCFVQYDRLKDEYEYQD